MFAAFGTRIDLIWHFSHFGGFGLLGIFLCLKICFLILHLLIWLTKGFGNFSEKKIMLTAPSVAWDIWVGHLGGTFGRVIWVGHLGGTFWGEHWDQHEIS